ncbi:MAG: hypothetical protein LBH14_07100 [Desulfobulbaceae bacterium]|nr:hypothetical protein [Desulfobulbaceae bacterium]
MFPEELQQWHPAENGLEITQVIHHFAGRTRRRAVSVIGAQVNQGARHSLIGGLDGCRRWPLSGGVFTNMMVRLGHFGKA